MDPVALKGLYGGGITFWGGLGSQSTIPYGTPDEIRSRVRILLHEVGSGGGYILAPAKPLMEGTPIRNAAAILEAFTDQS